MNKEADCLTPEAFQKLIIYEWPGNVRELENVIERSVVFATRVNIDADDITLQVADHAAINESFQEAKAKIVARFEQNYINGMLIASQGNITRAAHMARKDRRAFWALIRKHDINVQNFKPDPLQQT